MMTLRLYAPEEFDNRGKVADAIKADAAGRVCGDCQFARLNSKGEGWCTQREGVGYYLSPELKIYRRDAVACDSFEKDQ